MKRISISIVGAACAAALCLALAPSLFAGGAAADEAASPPPTAKTQAAPLVETVESLARSIDLTLRLRGVTEAWRRVDVGAETGGLVISQPTRKGARVEAGALLCEIEAGDRPSRLQEAKARLAEAEASAAASAALAAKGFSAQLTRARDAAALASAQAEVDRAELDLRRTRILAPFAGTLETDSAEIGALLTPGGSCATIIDLDPIHFVGFASELEVGALKVGQAVIAELAGGRRIEARLSFVAQSADARTRTFRIEAEAANPPDLEAGGVREGVTAMLLISTGVAEAHQAPRSALVLNDAGALGVMLVENKTARFAPVTILSDVGGRVAVAGPPSPAEIIVTGQYFVSDGAAVRVSRTSIEKIGVSRPAPAAAETAGEPTQ